MRRKTPRQLNALMWAGFLLWLFGLVCTAVIFINYGFDLFLMLMLLGSGLFLASINPQKQSQ